jgi:Co/Zn/Cd efflux system component
MGMGSFQVIRESIEHIMKTVGADTLPTLDNSLVSIVSMIAIILFKLVRAIETRPSGCGRSGPTCGRSGLQGVVGGRPPEHPLRLARSHMCSLADPRMCSVPLAPPVSENSHMPALAHPTNCCSQVLWLYCRAVKDLLEADGKGASVSTIDAMAQDHINDCLSNAVAVVAVVLASYSSSLWWVDPVGAIFISLYIMWSWYARASERDIAGTEERSPRSPARST